MAGHSKVLPVPYFTQPTSITCQSTCLKMVATYFEQWMVFQSTGAADRDIGDIWKDINESADRPIKFRNAHGNMLWWLETYFSTFKQKYITTADEIDALKAIVRFIDAGVPVMVSVSHVSVKGHIILVVGYENYLANASHPDFSLVVHDPYGRFDPSLKSRVFGKKRWDGGACLTTGGEKGPGAGVRLTSAGVSRQRVGDKRRGKFYLMGGSI